MIKNAPKIGLTITFSNELKEVVGLVTAIDMIFPKSYYSPEKMFSSFQIVPEITQLGRWHFHAILCVKDNIKYRRWCGYLRKTCGFIKEKSIKNVAKWNEYLMKQVSNNSLKYGLPSYILTWITDTNVKKFDDIRYIQYELIRIINGVQNFPHFIDTSSFKKHFRMLWKDQRKERREREEREVEERKEGMKTRIKNITLSITGISPDFTIKFE